MHRSFRLAVVVALGAVASAHEREFTQSRDWFLPYQGEHEIELRNFFDTNTGDYKGQLEYEYGVTSWFAIEPGIEIKEKPNGEYEVEGAELEFRFHFLEFDYDKWLPALNVEYEQPFEDKDGDEPAVELKTVLSRYGKNGHDFTVNLNVGKQLSGEKESESEATAGYIMPLHPDAEPSAGWHEGLRAGVELVQDFEEHDTRVGPLFVYRATGHWNVLGSYLFAVDDRGDTNSDQLTLILEFEF
ncbi:MAG: hypothetical protein K8S98_06210 [Planctomycetes bacterium]|nr:hypothetical protein [Planctomycetota bacterium]